MDDIEKESYERRLVRVPMPDYYLKQIFTRGEEFHFKCIEGLPAGAVLVSGILDISTFIYYIYFSHASFDYVQPGDKIPELVICFENIRTTKEDGIITELYLQRI